MDQDWGPNLFHNNIDDTSDTYFQDDDIPIDYESHPFPDKGQFTKRHFEIWELVCDGDNDNKLVNVDNVKMLRRKILTF